MRIKANFYKLQLAYKHYFPLSMRNGLLIGQMKNREGSLGRFCVQKQLTVSRLRQALIFEFTSKGRTKGAVLLLQYGYFDFLAMI